MCRRQAAGSHAAHGRARLTSTLHRFSHGPRRQARAVARLARLLLAPFLSVTVCCTALGAGFEAGRTAYDDGDFTGAHAAWTEAAVAGDGEAQYALGMMLANGTGVPRDVISAYAWFALADRNGVAGARDRFETLLRDHIPRHCHYHALKLVRDFDRGHPERLAAGGRQNSRCWRVQQR